MCNGCLRSSRRNYRSKHVDLVEIINEIIIVASSWLFILLYSSHVLFEQIAIDLSASNEHVQRLSSEFWASLKIINMLKPPILCFYDHLRML